MCPNQTAANFAGRDKMNTCETATMDWPIKATQKRSGWTPNTFTQAPRHVPKHPNTAAILKPYRIMREKGSVSIKVNLLC